MLSMFGLDLLLTASLIAILRAPELGNRSILQFKVGVVAISGLAIMLVFFILALFDVDPFIRLPIQVKSFLSLAIGVLTLALFLWLYIAVRGLARRNTERSH
jgi:hypothetical protein